MNHSKSSLPEALGLEQELVTKISNSAIDLVSSADGPDKVSECVERMIIEIRDHEFDVSIGDVSHYEAALTFGGMALGQAATKSRFLQRVAELLESKEVDAMIVAKVVTKLLSAE